MVLRSQFCFVVLHVIIPISLVFSKSNCNTPEGERGKCVNIDLCKKLNDLEYLRNSHCGRQGDNPKVCCPLNQLTGCTANIPIKPTVLPTDLLPAECGLEDFDEDKIIGGEVAGIRQFPWMALIEYKNDTEYVSTACGGSLISKRYVITAGHCVVGKVLKVVGRPVNVHLGEHDKLNEGSDCVKVVGGYDCTDDPVVIPIEECIPHPQYELTTVPKSDIALIRLSRNVEFTDFIRPICLPDSDRAEKLKLFVAGWGATEDALFSQVKMFVAVPPVDLATCQSHYVRYRVTLGDGHICAGGRNKDTCRGDSGGPLMDRVGMKYYLIGVTSFGSLPCSWLPGVYTKTFAYMDWIMSNIKP